MAPSQGSACQPFWGQLLALLLLVTSCVICVIASCRVVICTAAASKVNKERASHDAMRCSSQGAHYSARTADGSVPAYSQPVKHAS